MMFGLLMGAGRRKSYTRTTGYKLTDDASPLFSLRNTKAGTEITEETVLGLPAFLCGVMKIADTLKLMPFRPHEKLERGGSVVADKLAAYKLFKIAPNPEMSPSRFLWLVPAWEVAWGKFYANIEWNENDDPIALWPIHPSRVYTMRDDRGEIVHKVLNNDGRWTTIRDENMLHSFRFSRDGISGTGAVGIARESLGFTVAANEYGAKYFGNNAMPAHLIIREEELDEEALKKVRNQWVEANSGDKAGGMFFLGGGSEATKVQTLTLNNTDSQFLETRTFQLSEVARMIPISPMLLYDYGRATWDNFQLVWNQYLGESVMPIGQDFEEECNRKLLRPGEQGKYYFKFNPRGQLRAAMKEQYDSFTQGLNNGFLCVDEVRELMDLNPLPDGQGQVYMRQGNMVASAEIAAKIARLKAGQASSADIEFLREVVKAFIADGTIADVIANNTRFGALLDAVGIPREPKVADPYLPIIADNGQRVSGGTIEDDEGDVIGGDVLPSSEDPGDGREDPPPQRTGDDPEAKPTEEDKGQSPPAEDREGRASGQFIAAFEPVLSHAISRMKLVEVNADKRIAKAADGLAANLEFEEAHVERCRAEFGPIFDGLAVAAGIAIDTGAVVQFTARAAALYVAHRRSLTAAALLSCFETELLN